MIKEEKLIKHYSNIAKILDEMVPWEWDNIALYAEARAMIVDFYYMLKGETTYEFCDTIDRKYRNGKYNYNKLRKKLEKSIKKLWLEFKNSDEEAWTSMTFKINSDFEFSIDFNYDELPMDVNWAERQDYWAYKTLGIIYEEEYKFDVLDYPNSNMDYSLSQYIVQYKRDEYKEFLRKIGRDDTFNEKLMDKYYEDMIEILNIECNLNECEEVVVYSDTEGFNIGIFRKLKNDNKYEEVFCKNFEILRQLIIRIYLEQGKNDKVENLTAFIFRISSDRELKAEYRKKIDYDGSLLYKRYYFAFKELGYITDEFYESFEESLKGHDKELYEKLIKAKEMD